MSLSSEQREICLNCPYGKEKEEYFLKSNNSAFDAAYDMMNFVNACYSNKYYDDCLIRLQSNLEEYNDSSK